MSESDESKHLSDEERGRLDRLINQFELDWSEQKPPNIEALLPESDPLRMSVLIELVRIDLSHRLALQEAVRVEDYLKRVPELSKDRAVVQKLIQTEYQERLKHDPQLLPNEYRQRFPDVPHPRLPVKGIHTKCPHCHNPIELVEESSFREILCPSCGSSFSLINSESTASLRGQSTTVAHFDLLEKLGIGHFGTVWKARDTRLDRIVAVKLPRQEQLNNEETEQFFREARAAAQIKHPHIVSVHEVGREDKSIYIVSDYVQGANLREWLTGQRLTNREAVELCVTIAEALHHAHEAGVIHRDLKPANIMMDLEGQPHIMDFGLAKREAGEITMTLEGKVLGTPAYMPPEQARGEGHHADRRSDVYALGVILYELLTGELPFRGEARMLIVQILKDDPPSPRKLDADIPRDLETICLKCLEKDPTRRYLTAQDLADDLKRWQTHQPITARPITRLERTIRWCKRNTAIAVSSLLVVSSLLSGITIASWFAMASQRAAQSESQARLEAVASQTRAEEALTETEEQKNRAEVLAYSSQIKLAQRNWEEGNLRDAQIALERCQWNLRGWEYDYLNSLINPEYVAFDIPYTLKCNIAVNADGSRIATSNRDDTITIWDTSNWASSSGKAPHSSSGIPAISSPSVKPITIQPERGSEATRYILSKDGTRLVSVSGRSCSIAVVWDTTTGEKLFTFDDKVDDIYRVIISPDNTLLAIINQDETLTIWDALSGSKLHTHVGTWSKIQGADFSPDSMQIAATVQSENTGEILIWDSRSNEPILRVPDLVSAVVFSADGTSVFGRTLGGNFKAWETTTGKEKPCFLGSHFTPRSPRMFNQMAISRDGKAIAWGNLDGSVEVRTELISSPRFLKTPKDTGLLRDIRFTDGHSQLFLAFDREIQAWDISRDWSSSPLHAMDNIEDIAFSPDGMLLAIASAEGSIKMFDAIRGEELTTWTGHAKGIGSIDFCQDGTRLVSGSDDSTIRIWDTATGKVLLVINEQQGGTHSVDFSPDGGRVVAYGVGGIPKIWDSHSGEVLLSLVDAGGETKCVGFTADGSGVICGSGKGLKIWDATSGEMIRSIYGEWSPRVYDFEYDSSQSRLVSLSSDTSDSNCEVWDTNTWQQICSLNVDRTYDIDDVTFVPDGTRVVTVGGDGKVRIWDSRTGTELLALESESFEQPLNPSIAFHPYGTRLVAVADGANKPETWTAIRRNRENTLNRSSGDWGSGDEATYVEYNGDGSRFLSANGNGTFTNWNAETGSVIKRTSGLVVMRKIMGSAESVVKLATFYPDGSKIAGAYTGGVAIWDSANGELEQTLSLTDDGIRQVTCVALSSDATKIVCGMTDGEVKLLNTVTGEEITTLIEGAGREGSDEVVRYLEFSPDDRRLLSCSLLGSAMWDVETRSAVHTFQGPKNVTCKFCTFSPDGKQVAACCQDLAIRIWDAKSGDELQCLLGHRESVYLRHGIEGLDSIGVSCVDFSPDGTRLASGGDDATVRIWELNSGEQILSLTGLEYPVLSVAFSPDGTHLISGCEDGTIKVWELSDE